MSKHTPGPWSTDEANHDVPLQDIRIVAGHDRRIALVWIDDAPVEDYNIEQRANARLIARAPEMAAEIARLTARVEELEAALRPLACTCEAESQDECSRSEKHCPFWNARAALTKGESNDH